MFDHAIFLTFISCLAMFSAPYVVTRLMSDFKARRTSKTTWVHFITTAALTALILFGGPLGDRNYVDAKLVMFIFGFLGCAWPIAFALGLAFAFWMLAHKHDSPKAKTFLEFVIASHLSCGAYFIYCFGL